MQGPGPPPLSHRLALPIVLGVAVAGLYWDVVFGGQSFAARDHLTVTVPVHAFIRESLLAGRVPEWWDRVDLGVAFAANPATQGMSPIAWAFSLLPQPFGADVEPLAYLWLFGWGVALLARRLGAGTGGAAVAGILAVSSGYMGSLIPNAHLPHAAWMPWIAWAADRFAAERDRRGIARAAAVLSVFAALQLTGPEPGTVVTAILLAAAVLVMRSGDDRLRKLGWGAGAVVVGVGLAAFTVFPAFLAAANGERSGGLPLAIASVWSLHPLRIFELVWPHLLGDPVGRAENLASLLANAADDAGWPAWSFSVFVGAPTLLFAFLGATKARGGRLLAVAALFLVLSLGRYTPAFEAFRWLFPPERYMRYPEKHILGALVLLWVFAGVGVSRLRDSRRALWAFAATAAVLASCLGVAVLVSHRLAEPLAAQAREARLPFPLDPRLAIRHAFMEGALAVAALLVTTVGVALSRSPRLVRVGTSLAVLATVGASWRDTRGIAVLVPRHSERPALLERVIPGSRIYRSELSSWSAGTAAALAETEYATLAGDIPAQFGVAVLPGFDHVASAGRRQFWRGVFPRMSVKSFAALFGVEWGVLNDFASDWTLTRSGVARSNGFTLVHFSDVRPRAFVTSSWVAASSQRAALNALAPRGRDPRAVVLEDVDAGPSAPPEISPCFATFARPERVEIACRSGGGYAVLLDEYTDGWSATVDGAPADIRRADGLFRAIAIPPGVHRVVFAYETPGLALGLSVSLASTIAVGLTLVAMHRRAAGLAKQVQPIVNEVRDQT